VVRIFLGLAASAKYSFNSRVAEFGHRMIDTTPADSALLVQPRHDELRAQVGSKIREQLWDQCSADARALLRLVP
jgi:hypothetical protein